MIRFLIFPLLIVAGAVGMYARARGRGALAWAGISFAVQVAVAAGLLTVSSMNLGGIEAESNLIGLVFLPPLLGGGGPALALRLLPRV